MTVILSTEVSSATDSELARAILDNANGSPMGDSFVRQPAIELAKRTLPGHKQTATCGQKPTGNLSQGQAEPSAAEKRLIRFAEQSFANYQDN